VIPNIASSNYLCIKSIFPKKRVKLLITSFQGFVCVRERACVVVLEVENSSTHLLRQVLCHLSKAIFALVIFEIGSFHLGLQSFYSCFPIAGPLCQPLVQMGVS
jgi:hypothetical protein